MQGRYGQGILTLARNEKTGPVVSMHCINAKDDILIITSGNVILRTSLEQIREIGRNTQGVKVIDLADDDVIVGVAVMDGSGELVSGDEADPTLDGVSANGASAEDGTSPKPNRIAWLSVGAQHAAPCMTYGNKKSPAYSGAFCYRN